MDMTWKKAKLFDVQDAESIKLHWKIRRQVQQELLQRKLEQCFLRPRDGDTCIKRYPEAMQPMIRDFMRKADEQAKLHST